MLVVKRLIHHFEIASSHFFNSQISDGFRVFFDEKKLKKREFRPKNKFFMFLTNILEKKGELKYGFALTSVFHNVIFIRHIAQ